MSTTSTGGFPLGFRRGGGWQDDLDQLLRFAIAQGFEVIDLPNRGHVEADVKTIARAGLRVGTADLPGWRTLVDPDASVRKDAVAECRAFIAAVAGAGVHRFFAILLPPEPNQPRKDRFDHAVESLGALIGELEKYDAAICLEGWPCDGRTVIATPETYRALFKALPNSCIAATYDPSHLVRMGIDPIRFVKEFAPRVRHVHGKDTIVDADRLYTLGHEMPPTFTEPFHWGGGCWRYVIPGRGVTDWPQALGVLKQAGYQGPVCIELEDADFNGTEDGEKQGLISARANMEQM